MEREGILHELVILCVLGRVLSSRFWNQLLEKCPNFTAHTLAINFIDIYSDFYSFKYDPHIILNSEPKGKKITSLYGLSAHSADL